MGEREVANLETAFSLSQVRPTYQVQKGFCLLYLKVLFDPPARLLAVFDQLVYEPFHQIICYGPPHRHVASNSTPTRLSAPAWFGLAIKAARLLGRMVIVIRQADGQCQLVALITMDKDQVSQVYFL